MESVVEQTRHAPECRRPWEARSGASTRGRRPERRGDTERERSRIEGACQESAVGAPSRYTFGCAGFTGSLRPPRVADAAAGLPPALDALARQSHTPVT